MKSTAPRTKSKWHKIGTPMTASTVSVAMRCGLFATTFEAWHGRMTDDKTWIDFQDFWGQQFLLKKNTASAAGNFGYGMSATGTNNAATEAEFDKSINKFAAAHSATQSTISGLTSTNQQLATQNQQLQQQLAQQQMMCQAMNQQPAPMWQMPFQQQRQQQQQWNNNGGRGGYRGKKNKKKNGGWNNNNNAGGWNPGNNAGGWNPGSNAGGWQQQQQQWPRHTQTGQPIDPKKIKRWNNDNYCWTHGGVLADDH